MKTVARYFALSLMALLLFSCLKEEFVEGPRKIELIAHMEAQEDSLSVTKTHLSGLIDGMYFPLWSEGDEIGVYINGLHEPQKFDLKSGAGTGSGVFSGVGEGIEFLGLYPFQMAGGMADGVISLELPMNQRYVEASFDNGSFPMIGAGAVDRLQFKNLCALLKVSLKGSGTVSSITVVSRDKEILLSGRATAQIDGYGNPQLTMLQGGSDTVVLNCDMVQLQKDSYTDFYIVIPAQTYKSGLEVSVKGIGDIVRSKTVADLVFERSQVRSVKKEVNLKENDHDYVLATEKAALIEFYNSTNGDNWTNNTNWCSDRPVGEWYGVRTDWQGRVIGLDMGNNSLLGKVPKSIENLQCLETIYFSWGNSLSGEILEYICNLTNLREIFLANNNFTGSIPKDIDKLTNLCTFDLENNNFTGTIPNEICSLTNLESFNFRRNNFTGTIPAGITNLKKLWQFQMDENNLSGSIPENIGDLTNLRYLFLHMNNFTGHIPESVCNLQNLEILNVYANNLTGEIPRNIGNLTKLTGLWLANNYLTGSIPESMGNLTNIGHLNGFFLDNNMLSGKVPRAVLDSELWRYQWLNFIRGNKFRFEDFELYGPDETVTCLNGETVDLGELIKGNKYTILHTWIGHKHNVDYMVYPQLQYIYEKYSGKGVEIVSWTKSEYFDKEGALEYIRDNGMEWYTFLYGEGYKEGENRFKYYYDTELSVVDSTGRVVYTSIYDNQISLDPNRLINLLENDFKVDKQSDLYESDDYSSDGKIKVIQKASKGNGIDVVLMGDGYSDRLIADGTYDRTMETASAKLFEKEPYKSYKEYFNVYSVYAVSQNEVYAEGSSTVFECSFDDHSTHIEGNIRYAMAYAAQAVGFDKLENTTILVALNSKSYAGTCYINLPAAQNIDWGEGTTVSFVPICEDDETFGNVLHHETCGHGFAKLADEYAYEYYGTIPQMTMLDRMQAQSSYGWWKNIDFTSDPAQVRWKKFLQDTRYANEGLGVFEGADTYWYGVWKPTQNSIMVYNTGEFNAPSREAIYYRIHKLAYGPDWEYDYEKFVEYDAINLNKAQTKAPLVLDPQKNFKHTAPPVIMKVDASEIMNQKN